MAKPDEARLHEILDIVEQARAEGDKDTEARAIAAYKRETSPEAIDPDKYYAGVFKEKDKQRPSVGRAAVGALDATATNLYNMLPNAAGSVAAIAAPWVGIDSGKAEHAVKDGWTRQPFSQAGREANMAAGQALSPLIDPVVNAAHKADEITGLPLSETARHSLNLLPFAGLKNPAAGATATEAEVNARGAIPTESALKTAKNTAYQKVSAAGLDVQSPVVQQAVAPIAKETLAGLHPKTAAVLQEIGRKEGTLTLDDVERIRQMAGEAQYGHTIEAGDARRLGQIRNKLDDVVKDMASSNPATATDLADARNLYSRFAKSQDLSDMVERAYRRADSSPSLTRYNALQTELRRISVDKDELRRYTPEEQSAIIAAAKSTKPEAVFREFGKLAHLTPASTAGIVGGTVGHLAGGSAELGAAGAAAGAYVVGSTSRKISETLQKGRVEALGDLFRRGPINSAPLNRDVVPPKGPAPLGYRALPSPQTVSPAAASVADATSMSPVNEKAALGHPGYSGDFKLPSQGLSLAEDTPRLPPANVSDYANVLVGPKKARLTGRTYTDAKRSLELYLQDPTPTNYTKLKGELGPTVRGKELDLILRGYPGDKQKALNLLRNAVENNQ